MPLKWLALFILIINSTSALEVNEIFAWKTVEFPWPDNFSKLQAIQNRTYIPENNSPLGVAKWKNKVFVTLPKWKAGVVSTLNYVEISDNKSPVLIPYPSWEMNYVKNMTAVQEIKNDFDLPLMSVFRVSVDACDRLWVLDDGIDNKRSGHGQSIKRSILIFDLKTDKLIRRYFFKKSDQTEHSFFANIVVDVTSSTCDSAYAYIADLAGFKLVVYKMDENISWNINHLYFYPDPLSGEFFVGGVTTHWIDGILGLALSDVKADGYRNLYFHALTSTTQFHVSTEVIRNITWGRSEDAFYDYKITGGRGIKTQSTNGCFDEQSGIIVFTQVNKNGLAMWHTNTKLIPETFKTFYVNDELLEFPADIKIDNERNILVLSNKLPKFFAGILNENDINTRILSIPAQSIV